MIAEMKKVQIAGLLSQRNQVIRQIQKLGVMQIESSNYNKNEHGDVFEFAEYDEANDDVLEAGKKLKIVKDTIEFLEKILTEHNVKIVRPFAHDDEFVEDFDEEVWEKCCKLQDVIKQYNENKAEQNSLRHELSEISVWSKLQYPLDLHKTEETVWYVGTIPNSVDSDSLNGELEKLSFCQSVLVNQDKDQKYILVVAHEKVAEYALRLLHNNGFVEADFGGAHGTAVENVKHLNKQLSALVSKNKKIESDIVHAKKDLEEFKKLHDYLLNLEQRHHIRGKVLKTQGTFFILGYVAEDDFESFRDTLKQKFKLAIVELPIAEGEKSPILFKNHKFVAPFEMVTKMFSLPDPGEADPNFLLSIFYSLFFGLMLSDAGYGLVLCVGTFIAMKFLDLKGMVAKLVRLLFICGLSTIFWGVIFGSWFGNFADIMLGKPEGIALWFNPLNDPMKMLIFAFILGVIHLLVGMGMKGYILIKKGKVLDAIFDIGLWYVLYIGIALLIFPNYSDIGGKIAIAGVVGLILTQGRHEKGIIKKLFKGVTSLYGIVNFFSDVLSYSRVLALALATAVIGMVVNTMGTLAGTNTIVGIIVFTIAFLIGHTFNMAISALGAYVHSSRLQYVEFFGKFYSGGGKEFKPFGLKKHHTTSKK